MFPLGSIMSLCFLLRKVDCLLKEQLLDLERFQFPQEVCDSEFEIVLTLCIIKGFCLPQYSLHITHYTTILINDINGLLCVLIF